PDSVQRLGLEVIEHLVAGVEGRQTHGDHRRVSVVICIRRTAGDEANCDKTGKPPSHAPETPLPPSRFRALRTSPVAHPTRWSTNALPNTPSGSMSRRSERKSARRGNSAGIVSA